MKLDPLNEAAHRQLLLLYAWSEQWTAALRQAEQCMQLLKQEGLPLEQATLELVEALRTKRVPPPPVLAPKSPKIERSMVVAREAELAQLKGYLDLALAGQGGAVFVTGEAGCGKTALAQEFAWRALQMHGDLVVVGGNCNAYTGLGDPYLPFREMLGLLASNLETGWAAEAFIQAHVHRLQNLLPHFVRTLVKLGPDLISTFISGPALLTRAATLTTAGADWLTDLKNLVTRKVAEQGQPNLHPSNLFEQYIRVLQTLAHIKPLLLVLDDLQWADEGSLNLLFQLGRQLKGQPILVIGLYRPTDVALGRAGKRHPLEFVVNEFQGLFGDVRLALNSAMDKQFVKAIIATQANHLDEQFCEALYQHTSGHALFTIEILRSMQERGDLVKDENGQWIQGSRLNWEILPARIEGVMEERFSRLGTELQGTLKVASVEGERFLGEVAAQVQGLDEWTMIQQLSGSIGGQHQLVSALGSQRLGVQRLSHYRFHHILFQRYIYHTLDEAEKGILHERVGAAMERLYGEWTTEVAVSLAWHFQRAGLEAKAIDYLNQAGKRALRLSANAEAITHFTEALTLLAHFPDTPKRAQQELDLLVSLGPALIAAKGYAATQVEQTYTRAEALCRQLVEIPQITHVLLGLWVYYFARGELPKAYELGQQLLRLPQNITDPVMRLQAHRALGNTLYVMGEFTAAQAHFDAGLQLYTTHYQGTPETLLYGHDAGVICLSYSSLNLWLLGYPDQALARSRQALDLADKLEHPFNLAFAFSMAGILQQLCRARDQSQAWAEAALQLATAKGFTQWQVYGVILQSWAQTQQQGTAEKLTLMRQALDQWQATRAKLMTPYFLLLIAEAYGTIGQVQPGLSSVDAALTMAEASDDRWAEAELYRRQGELLWMGGASAEKVAGCFQQAIEVARRQGAKSLELRAVMSLSRLWHEQQKPTEARQLLTEIYAWFAEGFSTADLKAAKQLLQEWSP